MNYHDTGKEYSGITDSKRDSLIKKFSGELRRIKARNAVISEKINELREEEVNTYYLEEKLSLLTHVYKKEDYVLVHDVGKLSSYSVMQVLRLKKLKHYDLFEFMGLSCGVERKDVHERYILCALNSVRKIEGKVSLADESIIGKVKGVKK